MPANDPFSSAPAVARGPARIFFTVVPSDTVDLEGVTSGIYVGTAGNLSVLEAGGDVVVFKNVPAGSLLPVSTARVRATGTTASDLIGLV